MAVLHVRNIPDNLYLRAQTIAEERGSTLSALVIELIQQAATRDLDQKRHAKAVLRIRRNLAGRRNGRIAAVDLIHAARDERESERNR